MIKQQGSALFPWTLSVGLRSEETGVQSYMHLALDVFHSPEVKFRLLWPPDHSPVASLLACPLPVRS